MNNTWGPVEQEYRDKMNAVASVLDDYFNPDPANKSVCFTLLITTFSEEPDERVNYISNGRRKDIVNMLKELIKRFEGQGNRKLSIDDIEVIMRGTRTSTANIKDLLKNEGQ